MINTLMNTKKQEIIDKLIAYQQLPIRLTVDYLKRNIIVRHGVNITDWYWNQEFIRFYSEENLEKILKEVEEALGNNQA